MTPHSGEMARLCGITAREVEADRVKIAQDFAKEYGCDLEKIFEDSFNR